MCNEKQGIDVEYRANGLDVCKIEILDPRLLHYYLAQLRVRRLLRQDLDKTARDICTFERVKSV